MRFIIREESVNSEFGSKCGCVFCKGEKPLCVTYVKIRAALDDVKDAKLTDCEWTDKLEESHGFATFLEARLMAMMVGGEAVSEETLDISSEDSKKTDPETIVRASIVAAKVAWGSGWNLLSNGQKQAQVMMTAVESLSEEGGKPTGERLTYDEVMQTLRLMQLPWY